MNLAYAISTSFQANSMGSFCVLPIFVDYSRNWFKIDFKYYVKGVGLFTEQNI